MFGSGKVYNSNFPRIIRSECRYNKPIVTNGVISPLEVEIFHPTYNWQGPTLYAFAKEKYEEISIFGAKIASFSNAEVG